MTEADRLLLEKKIGRLKKLLQPPYMADIRFWHDTHHIKGEVVNCVMNVKEGKRVFHSERVGDSMQKALDECLQAIKSEIAKNHGKGKRRRFWWSKLAKET